MLPDERAGVLHMFAGLSARAGGSAVRPQALKAWLQEELVEPLIDRETLHLFRIGYITTVDGEAYTPTEDGWAAIDEHRLVEEEATDREARLAGRYKPGEPLTPAKEELPDVLILVGDWLIKAEAQRLTSQMLGAARANSRSR